MPAQRFRLNGLEEPGQSQDTGLDDTIQLAVPNYAGIKLHDMQTDITYSIHQGHSAVIGRKIDSQIFIPDAHVSREHFIITGEGDAFFIRNNSQTNGTFLNGQKLTARIRLNLGDSISLGDPSHEDSYKFKVEALGK